MKSEKNINCKTIYRWLLKKLSPMIFFDSRKVNLFLKSQLHGRDFTTWEHDDEDIPIDFIIYWTFFFDCRIIRNSTRTAPKI